MTSGLMDIIAPANVRRLMLAVFATAVGLSLCDPLAHGQPPALEVVFPPGAQAGQTVEVAVVGSRLESLHTLHCSAAGVRSEPAGAGVFRLIVPVETPPGLYDLWGVGPNGVSAPRTFAVGRLTDQSETEPNEKSESASRVVLNTVVNGRIETAGDADQFRFAARRGERVLIECWAERIDSRLRAVLEVFDSSGRRLAVNRGYFGIDPLVALTVPEDGELVVKVQDLIAAGSPEHYYRLAIDTGPRVAFTVPNVIRRGTASHVALYGWNFSTTSDAGRAGFERLDIELTADDAQPAWPLPLRLHPAQAVVTDSALAYVHPGCSTPVLIGVTDSPVATDGADNHAPETAREIAAPCDVSGQLAAGDECDWFSVRAMRGEVLHIEALGQRIGSPVDLQVTIGDDAGRELAVWTDETQNIGGAIPTEHLDPSGRWVCPADGRYLLAVRNLIGGLDTDPRRAYRLSVRREDAGFHVVAVPQSSASSGLNVPRGGRTLVELLAFRERGQTGDICVSARDLPPGIECPDVCLGPDVNRALLVVSANHNASVELAELILTATAADDVLNSPRPVRGGTVVRGGTPGGWGRLTSSIPLAVAGEAPLRITATAEDTLDHHLYGALPVRYSPGSVIDVAVEIERRDAAHTAPVRLVGVGLPEAIENQTAVIPAGEWRGYLSFYLPPYLPVGTYSLAVSAETTIRATDGSTPTVQCISNPLTFHVKRSAFQVAIDPFSVTRARRGETIQLAYSAKRLNGFIGKLHTELAAPGLVTDVVGLRGRGETFVGQVDRGSLQIVVNDDAPLGPQPFLRLLTVGVVEDQPTYLGSCFFPLEIVE